MTVFSQCKDNEAFFSLKVWPSGPPTETPGCLCLRQLPWGRRSPCLSKPLAVGHKRWAGWSHQQTQRQKPHWNICLLGHSETVRCIEPPTYPRFGGSHQWPTPSPDKGGDWHGEDISCSQHLIFVTCRMLSRLCETLCYPPTPQAPTAP